MMKKGVNLRCILHKAVLSLVLALYAALMQAQVTIGANESPAAGAILQLKEITNVTDSSQNASRGLALPRVQLSDVNQLYPMFLSIPADSTSGPNAAYAAGKADLDKTHTGLIVYNVTDDASKGLSPGLTQWDGSKWKPLSQAGGAGNAIFAELSCQDITVNGTYIANRPTNSQNFLTVNLTVTTPGAYTILVQSGNGYSFYATGMALNAGTLQLTLPAQGTPKADGTDILTFSGITLPSGSPCTTAQVNVSDALADFSLNCSSIQVNGIYQKGVQLDGGTTNYIKINVMVYSGGAYSISTPVVNGIRFSASGTFDDFFDLGSNIIYLNGSGTPTVNTDIPLTITSNSTDGTTSCNVIVPVTAPDMTYAIIGNTDVYSWDRADTRKKALTSSVNFGANPNSIVKISNFSQLWDVQTAAQATTLLTNGDATGKFPDIVLYFSYPVYPTQPLANALALYVQRGGCLIFGASNDDASSLSNASYLVSTLFNSTSYTAQAQVAGSSTDDNDYQIANLPNDPIINGPFGNLAGFYWGEDNASTSSVVVPQLPPTSVQICSAYNPQTKAAVNPANSIVWYDKMYNFVFFGDCGGSSTTDTSTNGWPVTYHPDGTPSSKLYGPGGSAAAPNYYIHNAQLEMNAVAWAIKRAISNGINPH